MVINKQEVEDRFKRSLQSYDENAWVQKIVVNRLCSITLASIKCIPRNILEIGCGTGLLTSSLKMIFTHDAFFYINDLVEDLCYRTAKVHHISTDYCLPGDIEQIELPNKFDLIISTSTFQWFTDPVETFRKLWEGLDEDGYLIFSTFGKYNLREIRLMTGRGLAYQTKEELTELLDPYFEVEKVVEDFHLMEFDNSLDVLQHMKRTGVNVSGDRSIWTRGRVKAFADEYNVRFGIDGKVALTYHPLYFVCRKKKVEMVKNDKFEAMKSKIEPMVYFVSGIDTDTGKSLVTGLLARSLRKKGMDVITQKFIQTGWKGVSEDILKHRKIMGVKLKTVDMDGTTCPYVMTYPASPHLAAEIDHVTIDLKRIAASTMKLKSMYDVVLLEGAGGLYVPVTREYSTIDYIREHKLPLILVTSSKLGSINHTLMSLELCFLRGIKLFCLVYNHFPNDSEHIMNDSITIFRQYLNKYFPAAVLIEVPVVHGDDYPDVDVSALEVIK